nr:T9SS type A sorting domain-containing protein [Bacteroidales bacterium]
LEWMTIINELVSKYYLHRTNLGTGEETILELPGTIYEYYDETGIGRFQYQLYALYESSGMSLPATTPDDKDYIIVVVTSIEENSDEEIVTLLKIYNIKGQLLRNVNLEELSTGVYILQGLTQDGKLVSNKVLVTRK